MLLQREIENFKSNFYTNVDKGTIDIMQKATQSLAASGILDATPKQGDSLKPFTLPNQSGQQRTLDDLLTQGPLVITFYRGGWCPYCNLELQAYQHIVEDIQSTGANLVAITPELPDASLSTTEKNELQFDVLSDIDANYARSLGLVFSLPEELKPIYSSFGIDIESHNGNGQFDLPLAATFVIAQDRQIIDAFVDTDYTARKEPSELLGILKSLSTPA